MKEFNIQNILKELKNKECDLSFSGYKKIKGMECNGFSVKVVLNKKIIAELQDDGIGAHTRIDWKNHHVKAIIEKVLENYAYLDLPCSVDMFFDGMVQAYEAKKERHLLAKKTIYAEIQRKNAPSGSGTSYMYIKGAPHSTETVQKIKKSIEEQNLVLIGWLNKEFPDTCIGVSFEEN